MLRKDLEKGTLNISTCKNGFNYIVHIYATQKESGLNQIYKPHNKSGQLIIEQWDLKNAKKSNGMSRGMFLYYYVLFIFIIKK